MVSISNMDILDKVLDWIIRIAIVIFGIGIFLVIVNIVISIILSQSLGPKSDKELMERMPIKIQVESVLGKYADIIDGSNMVILMRLNNETSEKIITEGISFFDLSTRDLRDKDLNKRSLTLGKKPAILKKKNRRGIHRLSLSCSLF